jgi:predicted small lipoprotein YifL
MTISGKRELFVAPTLLIAVLLCACGQTGELVLPGAQPPSTVPAAGDEQEDQQDEDSQ